jgi:hypothetical protein
MKAQHLDRRESPGRWTGAKFLTPLAMMAAVPLARCDRANPQENTGQRGNGVTTNCALAPIGVGNNPPADPEITEPVWCASTPAAPIATGHTDGFGGWVDPFRSSAAMAHFNDGDMGYHVFDDMTVGGTGGLSQHFLTNGYWIVDMAKLAGGQGAAISPPLSFGFQNGKLVIEADVTAGVLGFHDSTGADITWPELVWSTAPAPVQGGSTDGLYLYGEFQNAWAAGCRLQSHHSLTCAIEADHTLASVTNDQPPCFSVQPSRVMELSGFQDCGSTHTGFSEDFGAPQGAFRTCQPNQTDPCLDRFRLEWSKTGLVAYVNGMKYAEDSGWPSSAQLPDAIVNGSTPIYVYFGQWGDFSSSDVYRFHWQRIAVNPHDADGNLLPPSASPTFGSTTPMDGGTTPMDGGMTPMDGGTTPMDGGTTPAALVGDATVEGSLDDNSAGQAEAFQYIAAASGSATHLSVYLDGTNSASTVVVGLYTDNAGHPGQLLAQGVISAPLAGAWNSTTIASTALTAGARYWIAILGTAGTVEFRDRASGGPASESSAQTNLTALPATWTTGPTWSTTSASAYAQ